MLSGIDLPIENRLLQIEVEHGRLDPCQQLVLYRQNPFFVTLYLLELTLQRQTCNPRSQSQTLKAADGMEWRDGGSWVSWMMDLQPTQIVEGVVLYLMVRYLNCGRGCLGEIALGQPTHPPTRQSFRPHQVFQRNAIRPYLPLLLYIQKPDYLQFQTHQNLPIDTSILFRFHRTQMRRMESLDRQIGFLNLRFDICVITYIRNLYLPSLHEPRTYTELLIMDGMDQTLTLLFYCRNPRLGR